MKKRLLFALAFAGTVMGANAWNVDDYVFTKNARYKITGDNLIVNGNFTQGANKMEGWISVDESKTIEETFNVNEGTGPNGANTLQVLEGATALTNGAYQVVKLPALGEYVITMKVMNTAGAGFTDLDLSGGNTNYINAYYQSDETPVLAFANGSNNTILNYGTDGICAGYGFSYTNDQFTDVVFAVNAPADKNLIVDLRGLSAGLEIADIEVHAAQQVYDIRVPQKRIAWINTILNGFNWTGEEENYEDLKGYIADVEAAIKAENWAEMGILMENLNSSIDDFLAVNAENVLDLIPTKDGSSATGNNSANWMNWNAKWNKLTSDYKNQAPWSWSTDRWCHKTAATNSPMSIQWMRSSSGNWDNIATLTATLDKGTYFWGAAGSGGMMTLNKNRWARSWANECAETQFFFNGDTTEVVCLDPAVYNDYIYKFEVAEDGTPVTLGIRCNIGGGLAPASGFDVNFLSPVLYKMIEAGQLTETEKAYLAAVETQIEALEGRINVAKEYLTDATRPWGKEALAEGIAEAQVRCDAWKALTQDEILEMLYNFEVLADDIMNDGVRFINNNYITPFLNMNMPLTDMPVAIGAATKVLNTRMYESGDKATFQAVIASAQALYDEKIVAPFSSADSLALVEKKVELEAATVVFQNSIAKDIIVDVDFGTQDAPATVTAVEATEESDAYWYIDGAKGRMILPSYSAGVQSTQFDLGYNATDSLGMLRVGNGEAKLAISGAPIKNTDIVTIEFDYYFGNLKDKKAGFKVLTEANDTVCGLHCSKYSGNDDLNTFGIDYNGKINGVGSSTADNLAIAAESNRTHFLVVLDYGAAQMYCTTSGSKGTVTTEPIALDAQKIPATFVVYSDYNNNDRRSWFDNLKVCNVAAGAVDGIEDIQTVAPAASAVRYNVAGQKVGKNYKGIVIENGIKSIAK